VKTKTLFLLKVLGCSLVLFIFWPSIFKFHATIVEFFLRIFDLRHHQPVASSKALYYGSMPLILLISLVIATPQVKNLKRAVLVIIGIFAYVLLNFVMTLLKITSSNSTGWFIYQGIRVVLPFLIWIAGAYHYLGDMCEAQREEPVAPVGYSCPLCAEIHADIRAHLQDKHGGKSLKIKKVKRFMMTVPE